MRIKTMLSRPIAISMLGLTLAVAAITTAQAQSTDQQQFGPRANKQAQQQQAPTAEIVATHGDWKVQCETAKDGGDGKRACGMVQATKSDKNPKAFMNVIVVRGKRGEEAFTEMRMLVPLGVFLPMGVALEIDGQAIGRVGYVRCMGQICMATGDIKEDTLTKMRKGAAANFIIYEAPGIGIPMTVSLTGFSAALAELDGRM